MAIPSQLLTSTKDFKSHSFRNANAITIKGIMKSYTDDNHERTIDYMMFGLPYDKTRILDNEGNLVIAQP